MGFLPNGQKHEEGQGQRTELSRMPTLLRIEQACTAQTPLLRKAIPPTKRISSFHFARPSSKWKAKSPSARPFHHVLGFIREKQPLIDVFEEEDHLLVLAELPGVDEKDVRIKADESTITITAENATRKYLKVIKLPTRIKTGSVQFTYKNNILQVKLEKG
jgi:HSP20 family molecular chaperone IbpA